MARLVVAAPYSGSGKTTTAMGLMRALRARGLSVAPFKVGPDYIDTAYHSRICNSSAINLDAYLMGEDALKSAFCEYDTHDISIIEGVMGLYDGLGHTDKYSTSHVAKLIESPIVLVMDARGMAATAAAIVHGCRSFADADIRAVIVNNISGKKHYDTLKKAIEGKTGIPCAGFLPKDAGISIGSRHLGIVPQGELEEIERKLERIQGLIEENIDLDLLIKIAQSAPRLNFPPLEIERKYVLRVAVAMDKAFNFYYADNLALLERSGAELIHFSPIEDASLPECDGVYIGGGFPEVFAAELAQNASMRRSIREASLSGMPICAECGGYMYLMEHIAASDGTLYPMCGVFEGKAEMGKKLSAHFGYVESKLLVDTPIGPAGMKYRNHEFHHSQIIAEPAAYRATKLSNGLTWKGGCAKENTFGTYAHAYFRGELGAMDNFLSAIDKFKISNTK